MKFFIVFEEMTERKFSFGMFYLFVDAEDSIDEENEVAPAALEMILEVVATAVATAIAE